jgi:enolase-phosphatase E1
VAVRDGVTFDTREHGAHTIVLDIEGTTTPISFVYDVLFPFARTHLRSYVRRRSAEEAVREAIDRLRAEWIAEGVNDAARDQPPAWPDTSAPDASAAYVEWLMDRDRKSTGLKLLQGLLWEEGYRTGELTSDVFADVPPALRRWRDGGLDVAIYSSGSRLAQQLLFRHTRHGDLTPLISHFFDTAVGAKIAPESYRQIVRALAGQAGRTLFVSDVTAELTAARSAGWQTLLCVRPGNKPQPAHTFDSIESFDEVE